MKLCLALNAITDPATGGSDADYDPSPDHPGSEALSGLDGKNRNYADAGTILRSSPSPLFASHS